MVISQTPLRIGLVGGGTDLPEYYRARGGRVVNCAIDKYVYVIVKERFDDKIYVNYSRKEIVDRVADIQHDLVREAMTMAGIDSGVEITTLADIPSDGAGLGSSSSITVGLLNAFYQFRGVQLSAGELAERACEIEIVRLKKPIGKQDQYIAAFGGIRDLRFGPGDQVEVEDLPFSTDARHKFERQVMLFYTGITRSADTILHGQRESIDERRCELDELRDLAAQVAADFARGDFGGYGRALRRSWENKRRLANGITNNSIEDMIAKAVAAGAEGGKICGAGGGGFVLVFCPTSRQDAVRAALADYRELLFRIDRFGSRIVLNMLTS